MRPIRAAFFQVGPKASDEAAKNPTFSLVVERMLQIHAWQDPAAAGNWVKQWLVGDARDAALKIVAAEQVRISPAEAGRLVKDIGNPALRLQAVDSVAVADPARAYDWSASLPVDQRPVAVRGVLNALVVKDPERARAEFARYRALIFTEKPEVPEDSEGLKIESLGGTAQALAAKLAVSDPRQSLEWARSLPSAELRQVGLEGALAGWTQKEPAMAARLALTEKSAGGAEVVFEQWAGTDPMAALLEAQKIADPALSESTLRGVVSGLEENEIDDENAPRGAGPRVYPPGWAGRGEQRAGGRFREPRGPRECVVAGFCN